ncbi:hypothetical protein SUGI_1228330 [Cryptomeria japonica]|uniref:Uncharacterized protein n=1 Tax=Cryptomeria japonica TaxID=3369 RepID=A0AAD3NJP0_CRYJA|nr:hypothetical protein SUGI_1228330 [Cryptomeria japonica]
MVSWKRVVNYHSRGAEAPTYSLVPPPGLWGSNRGFRPPPSPLRVGGKLESGWEAPTILWRPVGWARRKAAREVSPLLFLYGLSPLPDAASIIRWVPGGANSFAQVPASKKPSP